MAEGEEVENKQVILNHCVRGSPKESDMEIRTARTKLKLPGGSSGAILVKNLYLSCEPYTYVTNGMSKMEGKIEGVNLESFNPGYMLLIEPFPRLMESWLDWCSTP